MKLFIHHLSPVSPNPVTHLLWKNGSVFHHLAMLWHLVPVKLHCFGGKSGHFQNFCSDFTFLVLNKRSLKDSTAVQYFKVLYLVLGFSQSSEFLVFLLSQLRWKLPTLWVKSFIQHSCHQWSFYTDVKWLWLSTKAESGAKWNRDSSKGEEKEVEMMEMIQMVRLCQSESLSEGVSSMSA